MQPPRNNSGQKSVLVVDDDEDVRELLCDLLIHEGYRVAGAQDGAAALEHLVSGPPPNVVLLDLTMPKMDGYEFLERRAADPRLRDIPVVVISGTTRAHRVPFPGEYAVTAVLPKPLQPTLLFDVLSSVDNVTMSKH